MDYIDQVFGTGGILHTAKGFAPRRGQIQLAKEIDSMLSLNEHLIAEAPTGTGKSIAYSVPAIYHATQRGRRALIVTANIALQEQLVAKDLPMLQELLPWKFDFAIAKGRGNYLCLDQYDSNLDKLTPDARAAVEAWLEKTEDGSFTDLSKHFRVVPDTRSLLAVESGECKGKDCDFYGVEYFCEICGSKKTRGIKATPMCCELEMAMKNPSAMPACWAERAKAKVWDADIVVTNYHMLYSDLKVQQISGGTFSLFPPFDILIMDEAHRAADIARDFMGDRLTKFSFRKLLGGIPKLAFKSPRDATEQAIDEFFLQLNRWGRTDAAKPILKKPLPFDYETLISCIRDVREWYRGGDDSVMGEETLDMFEQIQHRATKRKRLSDKDRDNYVERCDNMITRLKDLCGAEDRETFAYFVDFENDYPVLRSKVIYPGGMLHTQLFNQVSAAVLTSATLTVNGKFGYAIRETGLPSPSKLMVESPFDIPKQAKLIVERDMPDPSDYQNYRSAVPVKCEEIVRRANGRTLILCTSNRAKQEIYEHLTRARLPFKVLIQGMAHERSRLIEEFKRDVHSVLVGTESFWAGVDVPGESLSCVVIDRLPFPTPADPVLAAISENESDWFSAHAIPRSVTQFKQGFGRLVRAVEDHGVVVCLDKRIVMKPYGKTFIKSCGVMRTLKSIEEISNILPSEIEYEEASDPYAAEPYVADPIPF